MRIMETTAPIKQRPPVIIAAVIGAHIEERWLNRTVIGIAEALTRFGTRVVAVDLKLVPNCSAVDVTTTDQYPMKKPSGKQSKP